MNEEQQIESVEMSIEQARKTVALGEALQRLTAHNADFKLLIRENYFKDEPARLTQYKAAPSQKSPENQEAIVKALDAIGGLYQYFVTVQTLAEMAKGGLEEDLATLNELSVEEVQ